MGDPLDTRTHTRVLKTQTHPTRGFLVDEPSRGERGVADQQGMIGADMSVVSERLTVLRQAGAIIRRHPWDCA